MYTTYKIIISGIISSILLTNIPDLSILVEVLISFGVSFITILGGKLINYLSRKLDNIDLDKPLTDDNDKENNNVKHTQN